MSYDYDRLAASASRLIARFGQPAYLVRRFTDDYDPETATVDAYEMRVRVSVARFDYAQREIDGTVIQAGDQRVLMGATEPFADPKPDDWIEIDGERWRVMAVDRLAPAGVVVRYRMQVRK